MSKRVNVPAHIGPGVRRPPPAPRATRAATQHALPTARRASCVAPCCRVPPSVAPCRRQRQRRKHKRRTRALTHSFTRTQPPQAPGLLPLAVSRQCASNRSTGPCSLQSVLQWVVLTVACATKRDSNSGVAGSVVAPLACPSGLVAHSHSTLPLRACCKHTVHTELGPPSEQRPDTKTCPQQACNRRSTAQGHANGAWATGHGR
jgi:hypothetical protein